MTDAAVQHQEDALSWIGLEQELREERPRQWASRFSEASPNEWNRLMLILARHATHIQIQELIKLLENHPNKHTGSLHRWRQTLLLLAPNFFCEDKRPEVEHLYQNDHWLTHYKLTARKEARSRPNTRKTVVAFTGNGGLLMAPIPCILATLAKHDYDLIVVRRRHKSSYFEGQGQLIHAICKHLQARLGREFKRAIVLGTSSGGLAALCVAQAFALPLGIAIGAGAPSEPWAGTISLASAVNNLAWPSRRILWPWQTTRLLLAASAEHQLDSQSALMISGQFNTSCQRTARATALLFQGCRNHNLLGNLSHRRCPLEHSLIPLLNNNLTALPDHRQHS